MGGEIANGLLTLIQDGAAFMLNHKDTSSFVKIVVDGKLIDQLGDSAKSAPDGLFLDLSGLLDRLNVFDVVGDGNPERPWPSP